jgi:hypothetical protein
MEHVHPFPAASPGYMPASEAANEEGQTMRNMMIFATGAGAHSDSTASAPAQHPLLTMPAAAAGASVLSASASGADARGAKAPILRIGLEKGAPPPRTAADAAASDQKAMEERIQALEPTVTDISQLSFLVRRVASFFSSAPLLTFHFFSHNQLVALFFISSHLSLRYASRTRPCRTRHQKSQSRRFPCLPLPTRH